MHVESIKLKNFKSFKDVTMLDIPHYCVIVGANGTGKSTLFDAFGFLKDCLTYNVRQALQARGGYAEVVSRGGTGGAPIELEIQFRHEEGNPTGDLQVATNGARADALRRALDPPVLALVARCRLLGECGLEADHTTIWRWVHRYGPELEERLRRHLKPTHKSWRVDETDVRVKGRWGYLYRAIDSSGAMIDFGLLGLRDGAAAKRLFRKALTDPSHPQPCVINTDPARLYGSAISGVKKEGILRRCCRSRPVQYLNNIPEQDHRAIKRQVKATQGFREFHAARPTIQGYEAMHMIRKGQARRVNGSDVRRQIQFINKLVQVAA